MYVCVVVAQGVVAPVTAPGCAGVVDGVTRSDAAGEVPQPFCAATVTVPAAVFGVVVRDGVVLVPVQPVGVVHTYDVAPLTAAMLKVAEAPLHSVAGPVMVLGADGIVTGVTASVDAVPVPHIVVAVTEILPLNAPAPGVAFMLLVVDVPLHPAGSVQVYEVAPGTAFTEYVCDPFTHGLAAPLMAPGAPGDGVGTTANVLAADVPQPFVAVTLMFPDAVPTVVLIEAVVDVPLQPTPGNVHA